MLFELVFHFFILSVKGWVLYFFQTYPTNLT